MNSPFSIVQADILNCCECREARVIHIGLHQILDFYGTFTLMAFRSWVTDI